jgi:two-component system chemotaxis response regulator CheB
VRTIEAIKVLVVDDSAMVRKKLTIELNKIPEIQVIDTAVDPFMARDKIVEHKPDVILLDIEMPRMDGLTFLKKLMKHYPSRVIVVSSLAQTGGDVALAAIDFGAMEVIAKPSATVSDVEMIEQLIEKIKIVANIPLWRIEHIARMRMAQSKRVQAPPEAPQAMIKTTNKIVAIGASTGGTEAVRRLIEKMPSNGPPVVVVQHMPQQFTKSFAERLDDLCAIKVREAEDNEMLSPGKVLIAPGNYHMEVRRNGAVYFVKLLQTERVFHQRPAVEVLFDSMAQYVGKNAIGILLTGMGRDGATGMLRMRNAGAYTIAQDEQSCVVFGMPKEAIDIGAACKVLPLEHITADVLKNL